jgi:hypothetical protein
MKTFLHKFIKKYQSTSLISDIICNFWKYDWFHEYLFEETYNTGKIDIKLNFDHIFEWEILEITSKSPLFLN